MQAVSGLAVLWRPYGVIGAGVLVACNVLATAGLYAGGR